MDCACNNHLSEFGAQGLVEMFRSALAATFLAAPDFLTPHRVTTAEGAR
jgi:hypothetical protein